MTSEMVQKQQWRCSWKTIVRPMMEAKGQWANVEGKKFACLGCSKLAANEQDIKRHLHCKQNTQGHPCARALEEFELQQWNKAEGEPVYRNMRVEERDDDFPLVSCEVPTGD